MSGKRTSKTKGTVTRLREDVAQLEMKLSLARNELATSRDLCDVLRNDYITVKKEYSGLEATLVAERRKHSYIRSLYTAVSAHAQSLHALTELIK